MRNIKLLSILCIFSMIMWTSCTEDDTDPGTGSGITLGEIEWTVTNFPDVSPNYEYRTWLISEGVTFDLGKFTVDMTGTPSRTVFNFGNLATLENASQFIVSLEAAGSSPSTPSAQQMVDATFSGSNVANASTAIMTDGTGGDFLSSTGSYFLSTPTTSTMSEEFAGIWFGKNEMSGAVPGLDLPLLSPGWVYQGWVLLETPAVTLETGKFSLPQAADEAKPYSGSLPGFSFPGEDFNRNLPMMGTPPDLRGEDVFITIQPSADSEIFFPLPVLFDSIGTDVAITQDMQNVFPDLSGTVTRR